MPISNGKGNHDNHPTKVSGAINRGWFKPGQFGKGKKRLLNGTAGRLRVTEEQFEQLMLLQGGTCAVCGRPPKKNRLAVDHNHKTGQIRGLLCFRCNYGLSSFQEDANRLTKAGAYLLKFL